jgi:hypothetical protein
MIENTIQGNNTPIKRTHQQFGESRPQPPTTPEPIQCDRDPEKPDPTPQTSRPVSRARFLRTQQRASAFHPILTHVPRLSSEENQQY